jgi:SAM-dependent methyltransferase
MLPLSLKQMTDHEWLSALKQSVSNRLINGVLFPAFPPTELRERFVGSSYGIALDEAATFYQLVRGYAAALGAPVEAGTVALDFGTEWGRFLRFLWRDVDEDKLFGVDVRPEMIELCRDSGVPGTQYLVQPLGSLPIGDGTVSLILAYSVFTHLPEPVHQHWLQELHRVAKPGCVFALTVGPPRFIEFCVQVDDDDPSLWCRTLKKHVGDGREIRACIDRGEYVFLPTGGAISHHIKFMATVSCRFRILSNIGRSTSRFESI